MLNQIPVFMHCINPAPSGPSRIDPSSPDWSPNIVQGKTYDTSDVSAATRGNRFRRGYTNIQAELVNPT